MLQIISCTNKSCTFLYYNKNTAVANYNRVSVSGMKLSKHFCVHHIKHEPVLLTTEKISLYDCSSILSTLTYARVWFLFSWLNSGYVSNWMVILSKQSWYHHFENKFSRWLKIFTLKNHCVCYKYRNSSKICIQEIQQQKYLERLSKTWCLTSW